jgi:peptide deformylase
MDEHTKEEGGDFGIRHRVIAAKNSDQDPEECAILHDFLPKNYQENNVILTPSIITPSQSAEKSISNTITVTNNTTITTAPLTHVEKLSNEHVPNNSFQHCIQIAVGWYNLVCKIIFISVFWLRKWHPFFHSTVRQCKTWMLKHCDYFLSICRAALDAYKEENFDPREYKEHTTTSSGRGFCCCCFSCKSFLMGVLCLSVLSYTAVPKRPTEWEIERDSTINPLPLVNFMVDTPCYAVPANIGNQTFRSGIAFGEFVRSMRAHMIRAGSIGITSFHLGLPFCLLAYVDDERRTIRVLANPRLVGGPAEQERDRDLQTIKETDPVCPQMGSVERQRASHIVVEYQEMNTKGEFLHFRKNSTTEPLVLKEVMKGAPAYIVQHLLDTLSQKSLCIKK